MHLHSVGVGVGGGSGGGAAGTARSSLLLRDVRPEGRALLVLLWYRADGTWD